MRMIHLMFAALLTLSACGFGSATADTDAGEHAEAPVTAPLNPPALLDRSDSSADIENEETIPMNHITLSFNGHTYTATLADHPSAQAFAELLQDGPLSISTHDYGNFEKVGSLGTELPRMDEPITTVPGDIILYQGDQITVYYAQNTWSFTRLGRIDDPVGLQEALGSGDVEITFQLASSELPS